MTPCERYKQAILDAVDLEDTSSLSKDIQSHLKQCAACAKFYENLCSLKKGLQKLKPVKAPDSFQVVLRERIRREAANKPGIRFAEQPRRISAPWAIGAAALVVIGSLYLGQHMMQDAEEGSRNASLLVEETADELVSYVIDDLNRPSTQRSASPLSRIDSLLQLDESRSARPAVQPVSF